MKPILEVSNLNYIYSVGTPFEHKALDNISFSVERGEFIGIIGTKGEIFGNFEESKFTVLKIDPSPDAHNEECDVEEVDLRVTGDMVGAYGGQG